MALKAMLQTKYGVDLPDAYINFVSFTCDKVSITVLYNVYANEQAKIAGKPPAVVDVLEVSLTPQRMEQFFSFIYGEMKKVQQFKSVVDA